MGGSGGGLTPEEIVLSARRRPDGGDSISAVKY